MINLLIMILMAMSNGTECKLGAPADYYGWVNAHPDYSVAQEFNIPDEYPLWVMKADGDPDYYLFVFKEKDALDGGSNQHGQCFRDVGHD